MHPYAIIHNTYVVIYPYAYFFGLRATSSGSKFVALCCVRGIWRNYPIRVITEPFVPYTNTYIFTFSDFDKAYPISQSSYELLNSLIPIYDDITDDILTRLLAPRSS